LACSRVSRASGGFGHVARAVGVGVVALPQVVARALGDRDQLMEHQPVARHPRRHDQSHDQARGHEGLRRAPPGRNHQDHHRPDHQHFRPVQGRQGGDHAKRDRRADRDARGLKHARRQHTQGQQQDHRRFGLVVGGLDEQEGRIQGQDHRREEGRQHRQPQPPREHEGQGHAADRQAVVDRQEGAAGDGVIAEQLEQQQPDITQERRHVGGGIDAGPAVPIGLAQVAAVGQGAPGFLAVFPDVGVRPRFAEQQDEHQMARRSDHAGGAQGDPGRDARKSICKRSWHCVPQRRLTPLNNMRPERLGALGLNRRQTWFTADLIGVAEGSSSPLAIHRARSP
jgi:hypothetical protein